VHSAKGLEFKHVFVVGLEDGLFPISRAFNSAADMEEERRLLYVAITRARQGLHLSCAQARMLYGREEVTTKPSRFLREMGFCHIEQREEPQVRAHTGIVAKTDTAQSLGFKIGDSVRHEKFGAGKITEIIDKSILKIQFEEIGVKMLSLMYAKLEKVKG